MLPEWTGEAVKKMHMEGIEIRELAEKIGWHRNYMSLVLHGERRPQKAEQKVMSAIEEIIRERKRKEAAQHSEAL